VPRAGRHAAVVGKNPKGVAQHPIGLGLYHAGVGPALDYLSLYRTNSNRADFVVEWAGPWVETNSIRLIGLMS
jgi:hypothetical protein